MHCYEFLFNKQNLIRPYEIDRVILWSRIALKCVMFKDYTLGFPLSRDFSNFEVPGLLDLFSSGTTGPRDLQGL